MALASATQEVKFLLKLFNSIIDFDFSDSVTLYCDNQSAMAFAKNPVQHQRSKYSNVKYHFVRDEVNKGVCCTTLIYTI